MSEPESEIGEVTIPIHELLERSAESALKLQREDGSFPSGTNGPYQDDATPIRNTANWLKILSFAYNQTGKKKFKRASDSAVGYLKKDDHRPHGYTYRCRRSQSKDSCNGVVGQANVIEALTRAGDYLDRPELYDHAAEIYHLHPFNENTGVWNRVEIDGTVLTIDRTFNHQLIFAAASASLVSQADRPDIQEDVEAFLDNLPKNMCLDPSGVVVHRLRPGLSNIDFKSIVLDRSPELLINPVLHAKRRLLTENETHLKELAYHSVNLYWLACLKNRISKHKVWSHLPVSALIDVTREQRYRSLAEQRTEWFSNIPPGFQVTNAITIFESSPDNNEMRYWIEITLSNHYNKETDLFEKNSTDRYTLSGLLYPMIDLPNITVSF